MAVFTQQLMVSVSAGGTPTPTDMAFLSSTADSLTVAFNWAGTETPDSWGVFTSLNGAQSVQQTGLTPKAPSSFPAYDHIVVCIMENHSYDEIVGSGNAPYINSLLNDAALFTNYHAVTHPSQPNYFALYAGDTFGVTDDNDHTEADPSLATVLQAVNRKFVGYPESGSPRKHNPWESFPEGTSVEVNFGSFPSDFTTLPDVAFVIPNLNDDMHDGTIQQGDTWLQNNLDSYIQWAKTHNSLFILTFDEDDSSQSNQILTFAVGQGVVSGSYNDALDHYSTLATICDVMGAAFPRNAASAALYPTAAFTGGSGQYILTVPNLTAGNYTVFVDVHTVDGGWSGFLQNNVPYGVGGNTVPNVTSPFIFSPTNNTLNLQFTPPANTNGINSYRVQYKRYCDFTWIDYGALLQSSNTATIAFQLGGFAANTIYTFRVSTNGSRNTFWFTGTTTGGTDSPDGIMVGANNFGSPLIAADGTKYTFVENSAPYQIAANGTTDTTTSEVCALLYSGGKVYQQNKDYNWFSKVNVGDTWQNAGDPRVGSIGHGGSLNNFDTITTPANTVMVHHGGPIIDGCQVTMVFWGTFWGTVGTGTQSNPSAGQIASAVSTVYNSPYFIGQREYFITTKPTMASSFIINLDPPDFSNVALSDADTQIRTFITDRLNDGTIATPTIDNHMIFLVCPPGAHNPNGAGGYHTAMLYNGNPIQYGTAFYFSSSNTLGTFTGDIMHETTECMTDPWNVTNGTFYSILSWFGPGETSTPSSIPLEEIEDFTNPTEDTLNGVGVFGFYSNRERALIVPTA